MSGRVVHVALLLKYHLHLMWFSQISYDALTTASLLDFTLVTFLSLGLMIETKFALYVWISVKYPQSYRY